MKQETYNSRLKSNPEDIRVGSLLRVKKWCRENVTIRHNGEYGILVENSKGKYITHDVLFPNGTRCIFIPLNWEVVSDVS
jgi:hypothetical protein|tara:strand:+ start:284 stop:523 length:240 start_codon:yes stop_codon:yes gene_type:complete